MFRVRAEFHEDLEIGASVERVREYFDDLRNFVLTMPGVESIDKEVGGLARWTVSVDVGLVGRMRGSFRVVQTDDSSRRLEWKPAREEETNLLRYGASFEERAGSSTYVRVALRVELRRPRASALHLMAGLIGERRISAVMQVRVTRMMKTYLTRARTHLKD